MSHLTYTYSARVFDASLVEIFKQQARIQTLLGKLKDFCIHDREHGINIKGSTYLEGRDSQIKACLAAFNVPFTGTITQDEYNQFSDKVSQKLRSLNQMKSTLEQHFNTCSTMEKDYHKSLQSYRDLKQETENATKTVSSAKQEIKSYLDSCRDTISESDHTQHIGRLDAVKVDFKLPQFAIDLHKHEVRLTQNLSDDKTGKLTKLEQLQTDVFRLRADYSNLMNIKEMQHRRQQAQQDNPLAKIKAEIETLIAEMPNQVDVHDLVAEFNTMRECYDSSLLHRFRHLKTDLHLRKESLGRRADLNNHLLKLQQLSSQSPQVSEAIESLQSALNESTIKESQHARLCLLCDATIAEEERRREAEKIRATQVQYEKNQIINALRYLNYEVVSDTTVIDFSDNIYLFQVPNQDNFICFEYLNDRFLINFLIPEQIGDLSQAQKDRKVIEMSKVCDDYRKLLRMLALRGIVNRGENEPLGAAAERLVPIPERLRGRVEHLLRQEKVAHEEEQRILRMDHD
ncbi:MAG TPA: hypothetical protein PL126_02190 [Candidatus Cloacimonadota bacterium]|mgnify:CR=1 FL=1|nr:hypothetical protein [Candidatus Cloacimonadota bacterium]